MGDQPGLVRSSLAFLALLCGYFAPVSCQAESELLLQIRSAAAAGDLRPVSRKVEELDSRAGEPANELDRILLQQYRERFISPAETGPPDGNFVLANQAIAAYQDYWRSVLTHALPAMAAEQQLRGQLRSLLGDEAATLPDDTDVYRQLELALASQGLGSSAAMTVPWRDLYIWGQQRSRNYEVELTDRVTTVQVTFIEQPLVQGWQHFASLDLVATSGWASPEGLYCLCGTYDLDSPAFQVSWLKHETRHILDLREYPGMPEAHMEYRAKLTELAFAGPEVATMLRQFASSGSATGQSAHSKANHRVSRDIYREVFGQDLSDDSDPWQLLNPYQVAPAARRLLEKDTVELQAGELGS